MSVTICSQWHCLSLLPQVLSKQKVEEGEPGRVKLLSDLDREEPYVFRYPLLLFFEALHLAIALVFSVLAVDLAITPGG